MSKKVSILLLLALSAALLSIPFLVPGTGYVSLVAFIPLLFAENIATETGMKRFCWYHYLCFLLWNAATTFWVCNATVGGGIFACVANAFQMSLVFGLFRWSRKYLKGALPYLFLAFAWIAWEKWYLTWAQISWPWLVLGNSFARTTSWIQWYEFTGTLGGSLWIWAANLSVFGLLMSFRSGRWKEFNPKARFASIAGTILLFLLPPAVSLSLRPQDPEETLDVFIAQPNIDVYDKFGGHTQEEQNSLLLSQLELAPADRPILLLAPETFTNDVIMNDVSASPTVERFSRFLSGRPFSGLLVGASSWEYVPGKERPSQTARQLSNGTWVESHNTALLMSAGEPVQTYHKNKLVVGVEMTPYPAFFRPIDDMLGGVMGRCIGDGKASSLVFHSQADSMSVPRAIKLGCAICYESVYGEFCADYVRDGASFLTVITNDAWWGDTPGYRQHLSYASLRAIETRRWIARCGNTGISAIIDPSGRVVDQTRWWEKSILQGKVGLSDDQTFYVSHGDFVGRICIMMFLLILLGTLVRRFSSR
ncbi:MAG: apolipoprotein N-acyltransferase [Bacteroidales bacterium]|nr:apolipoprotein N-acyltransferase [Bacteroidales bacterium]